MAVLKTKKGKKGNLNPPSNNFRTPEEELEQYENQLKHLRKLPPNLRTRSGTSLQQLQGNKEETPRNNRKAQKGE